MTVWENLPEVAQNGNCMRARKLNLKKLSQLQEQRSGGRATGLDIQAKLKSKLQVTCCRDSAYNLLPHLDLVWITIRSKHPKQFQENQDAFTHMA